MNRLINPYAYRITPLLASLVNTQDETSHSLEHLSHSLESLNRNMDWVEGQMTLLSAFQDKLAIPEKGLTKTIGKLGPDIIANLAQQRTTLANGVQVR